MLIKPLEQPLSGCSTLAVTLLNKFIVNVQCQPGLIDLNHDLNQAMKIMI